MPTPVNNTFTTYELTPEEERIGHALSPLTLCVIQNALAELAQTKLNAVYDPTQPLQYAQADATLTGKMEILRWLQDQAKWANSAEAINSTQDRN